MSVFLYFIAGIIFIQWIVPIGDALANLIISYLEMLKGKASLGITQYNAQIQKLAEEIANPPEIAHHVIGFQVPSSEDYEEEEDD